MPSADTARAPATAPDVKLDTLSIQREAPETKVETPSVLSPSKQAELQLQLKALENITSAALKDHPEVGSADLMKLLPKEQADTIAANLCRIYDLKERPAVVNFLYDKTEGGGANLSLLTKDGYEMASADCYPKLKEFDSMNANGPMAARNALHRAIDGALQTSSADIDKAIEANLHKAPADLELPQLQKDLAKAFGVQSGDVKISTTHDASISQAAADGLTIQVTKNGKTAEFTLSHQREMSCTDDTPAMLLK